jgi:hypothetical protein
VHFLSTCRLLYNIGLHFITLLNRLMSKISASTLTHQMSCEVTLIMKILTISVTWDKPRDRVSGTITYVTLIIVTGVMPMSRRLNFSEAPMNDSVYI